MCVSECDCTSINDSFSLFPRMYECVCVCVNYDDRCWKIFLSCIVLLYFMERERERERSAWCHWNMNKEIQVHSYTLTFLHNHGFLWFSLNGGVVITDLKLKIGLYASRSGSGHWHCCHCCCCCCSYHSYHTNNIAATLIAIQEQRSTKEKNLELRSNDDTGKLAFCFVN